MAQDTGQPPSEEDKMKMMQERFEAAKRVVNAQQKAASLREAAKKKIDVNEQRRLLQESYNKEVEAHGYSKKAQRMQSGAWQGATGGGAIGGGLGLGVGAVVGTLVGGLVSIPTVALGSLVGLGVGAIHGPFFNFSGGAKKLGAAAEKEYRQQALKVAESLDQAVERSAQPPEPPKFDDGPPDENTPPESTPHEVDANGNVLVDSAGLDPQRRKPRKLQVRAGSETSASTPEKRKPRKIEVRSKNENVDV